MPNLDLLVEAFHPSDQVLADAIQIVEEQRVTYTGKPGRYTVLSGPRTYTVQVMRGLWTCQCLAYDHGNLCKHALAAMAWEEKHPTLVEVDIRDPFLGLVD